MPRDQNALIWIDLEMTGLNPVSDRIIEVATIVTDADLKCWQCINQVRSWVAWMNGTHAPMVIRV